MGWSVLSGWGLGRTARRPSTAKTAGSCSRTASVTSSATPRNASMTGLTVWWGELIGCLLFEGCVCVCMCVYLCTLCVSVSVCLCVFVCVYLCFCLCVWEREREGGVCVCIWERESACVCVGACERECVRECVGESVWVCWGERERGQEWVSLLVYAEILHMFCLNKAIITAVALNWLRTCCGNERP